MKTLHDLVIRLLQESDHGKTKVLVRNRHGELLPIEAIRQRTARVSSLMDDITGAIHHNEDILIIEVGSVLDSEIEVD